MILCLKIALIAILSSIAVEGYGPRYGHRRRSSRDREHFQLVSLGRNGPRRDSRSHGMHGHFHFYRYPYYRRTTILEELSRRWPYPEESSELDSGYSSEVDLDDFDSPDIGYTDWYLTKRHPCWPWRCPTQETNEGHESWTRAKSLRKTTLEGASMTTTKRWDLIPMLEKSINEQSTPEPVTTPTSILDITMSPKTDFILSRIAPIEEVPVLLTTVTPETSQAKMSSLGTSRTTTSSPDINETTMSSPDINETTMSSPETTTVSQAVLDCIENCISTSEFNPVCGTNDETYGNVGKLFCAKSCGVDVELRRMSRCFPVLPFADDYNDYDNNNNSNDGDDERRNNVGDEDSFNDYEEENENGGERLPPTTFEQSTPRVDLPFNSLTNILSSSSDDEPSPSPADESLKSLSSDPSSSPLDDLSPSPRAKSLSSNDEVSSSLSGNGNEIVTTGSSSFASSPTTPSAPRFRRTTHLSDLQKCMKICPVTTDYYPICGTDLVTYINIDRIECARACGLEVQILCESPCHLCNVGSRTQTFSTTTSTTPTTPTILQVATIRRSVDIPNPTMLKEQCVKACPVTPEYNPICGTNNVNYMNPVHLLCVQMCGDDVKIAKFGSCLTESRLEAPIGTTVADEEDITLSPETKECINRCVVTSEYNPVCGTNEETYTNPGKLECAKFCGIDVKLSYKGFCNGFFFSEFTPSNPAGNKEIGGQATASWEILRSTSLSTRLPLRRSTLTTVENIPQTTPTIIQSTESTTPFFLPLVYSPQSPSTFSSISSTTATTPSTTTTESFNSTSFTLPSEVLIYIFGNATLDTTTDMTIKEDEMRIDPRFGNEDDGEPNTSVTLDPNRIVFPE